MASHSEESDDFRECSFLSSWAEMEASGKEDETKAAADSKNGDIENMLLQMAKEMRAIQHVYPFICFAPQSNS